MPVPASGRAEFSNARRMVWGRYAMPRALRPEIMRATLPQALGEDMEVPFMSWLPVMCCVVCGRAVAGGKAQQQQHHNQRYRGTKGRKQKKNQNDTKPSGGTTNGEVSSSGQR